jgi:DNA modification methylase
MPTKTTQPQWQNRIVGHGEEAPDQLVANPLNWRIHPTNQQEALSGVLAEVGLVQQVVVNKTTGHLVDGHLRVSLAMRAGQPTLPVVYVELSPEEEALVLATLDPVAAMALPDADKVRELLEIAATQDQAVLALLEDLARQAHLPGPPVTEETQPIPEPPEEPQTKLGDLYILGDHRLLCGDATNSDDVNRLMAGKRAALMFTDPPYLVDYEGGSHPASEANAGALTKDKHWDAYLDHAHAVDFYRDFLRPALDIALVPDAPVYQCFGMMRTEVIWQAWREVGLLSHQVVIWKKSRAVLTYSWFLWDYEVVMVGWLQGHKPKAPPPADTRAVWEIDSTDGNEAGVGSIHPTIKPVELVRRPIGWHTKPGGLIYEPFSGSGTALIAAEQTGRACYAMELSPAYVDVAVQRWQNLTGQAAICTKRDTKAGHNGKHGT